MEFQTFLWPGISTYTIKYIQLILFVFRLLVVYQIQVVKKKVEVRQILKWVVPKIRRVPLTRISTKFQKAHIASQNRKSQVKKLEIDNKDNLITYTCTHGYYVVDSKYLMGLKIWEQPLGCHLPASLESVETKVHSVHYDHYQSRILCSFGSQCAGKKWENTPEFNLGP